MTRVYGIYDKNETLVCIGDITECTNYLGIKRDSLFSAASKEKHKPRKNSRFRVVNLGDEKDVDSFEEDPNSYEQLIYETKGCRYYALYDGTLIRKYKNGSVQFSRPWKHHQIYEVRLGSKTYNASRIWAKAFLKRNLRKDEVVVVDGNFHCENMRIMTKKERSRQVGSISAKNKTKCIGYYENNKLVKKYPSSRKAAADLYCSYQTILDICNGKVKRTPLVDVRYL